MLGVQWNWDHIGDIKGFMGVKWFRDIAPIPANQITTTRTMETLNPKP